MASTRASADAFAATSGPIPAGSPTVMAMRGFIRLQTSDFRLLRAGPAASGSAATGPAAAGAAAGRIVAATLAAASAVPHSFGVREFVAQAALESPAESGQLRGIETQLLLLRHLDRDRLERLQKRRAAERPAARAVA